MRLAIRLGCFLGLLALATMVLGNAAERWLIYPLDSTRTDPPEGLREVTLQSDGETLVTWQAAPRPGRPVILYFHGNAGNLAVRAGRFRRLLARGYGLVAPAYRGSSGSTGTPSEAALMHDAAVGWRALHATFPDAPGVVIYGESLGAAVALSLLEAPGRRPDGLILEAPFTSIAAMAAHHYPGTGHLAAALENQWPSLSRAAKITMPLLVLHGTNDRLVPITMGRQLMAAAPSREKQLVAVPGAGHTDLWRSDTLPALWRFLDHFALR